MLAFELHELNCKETFLSDSCIGSIVFIYRELAGQLREEVVEQVKDKGIKLYLVSIGPAERGKEYAKHTGFPDQQLLADPESNIYEALSLHNSALDTFFNPKVLSLDWHAYSVEML